MKLRYPEDKIHNTLVIMRKAGYSAFIDPVTKKESYILRLTSEYYPRFHMYIKEKEHEIVFDLHLDQKKPSYQGSRAHGGEYSGSAVEKEMKRLEGWINHEIGAPIHAPADHADKSHDAAQLPRPEEKKDPLDLFNNIFKQ